MGCCEISGIDNEKGLSIVISNEIENIKAKNNSGFSKKIKENHSESIAEPQHKEKEKLAKKADSDRSQNSGSSEKSPEPNAAGDKEKLPSNIDTDKNRHSGASNCINEKSAYKSSLFEDKEKFPSIVDSEKNSNFKENDRIKVKGSNGNIEKTKQIFPTPSCYRTSDNFTEISENVKLLKLPDYSSNSSLSSWVKNKANFHPK